MNEVKKYLMRPSFSPNPEGEVGTDGQGEYFDRVSPNKGLLFVSIAIKHKLTMSSLLYTSIARGKFILKSTSWQKIRENTHI